MIVFARTSIVVFIMLVLFDRRSSAQFSQWVAAPLTMVGVWERAETVVIAELKNTKEIGVQQLQTPLPWPTSPTVDKVYWCEGEFTAYSIIKGRYPTQGKRFIWGAIRPGCTISYANKRELNGRRVLRIWFVREEPRAIRPVVDGGGVFFLTFGADWGGPRVENPARAFAQLLLTPSANASSLSEFSRMLPSVGELACLILGRSECINEMRSLARLGNDDLKKAACAYSDLQLDAPCGK